jgi:type IV secretion system protein VirB2
MKALDASSRADPLGSRLVVAAVRWLEGTLLGAIAATVAMIAIACVGTMMLTGRVNPA